MPQTLLPLFPKEATEISSTLAFSKREGQVYYFHGCMPVFSHGEEDMASFRMFTSQLVVNGNCKQMEIVRAFGVSAISVKRYVKRYRQGGPSSFFKERRKRRATVLTPEVLTKAQEQLNEGKRCAEIAGALGIKNDTLSKAIRKGKLVEVKKKPKKNPPQKAGAV